MPTSLSAMLTSINDGGANTAAEMRAVITALYDWIPPLEKYKMGRVAGETAHAADDFFTTYTGYTEVDVTGTVDWTATRGGLTAVYSGQSSQDFSCALKAIPAAGVPITIETQVSDVLSQTDNPMWGILFTNGTTSAANVAGVGKVAAASGGPNWYQFSGTLGTVTATLTGLQVHTDRGKPSVFLRLSWAAVNTFGFSFSPDTENWTDCGQADLSTSFTPTHMGFFVSAWGSAHTQVASFRYLRVYEADLSV